MKSMRYLNVILSVLTVMLALQLWTTWTQTPDAVSTVHAQGIPDAGAQRNQIISQLKLMNKKTEELKKLLISGKVKVTVTNQKED